MPEQMKNEIIKALAYGETPEQVAAAECVDVAAVKEIQQTSAAEISEEQEMLKRVGFVHD